MCGICGNVSLSSAPVAPDGVRAMLGAMHHRGPDSGGLYEAPGVVAGIRRLAVIDVEGGSQPIRNEDGNVEVVFNGEIYNYRELGRQLVDRGHRLRTRSDTEVLVHLWEEYGPDMVHRLDGMFAFCIHDRKRRETFIARDRLGIKPLFYSRDDDRLSFASEIGVLLHDPQVSRDVDPVGLLEQFCLQFVGGDGTVYRNIRKLPPGHALHIHHGTASLRRWYTIPTAQPDGEAGVVEKTAELRELLEAAVEARRVADVPLGVFLSGGLDSTVIVHLLSERQSSPVKSFSVGFEGDPRYDERAFARIVAKRFGTDHHELVVSALDIGELLPRLVRHLAEPLTDPATIPTYLLSEFARREVTVALTGEGADELFGGYRRYEYQNRYGWLRHVPGLRHAGKGALQGVLPRRVEQALAAVGEAEPAANHLQWTATIGREVARRLFDDEIRRAFEERVLGRLESYFPGARIEIGAQLHADQSEWLPHNLLAKVDRATMAFSLEARVPFLDHRIVEWAATLPDSFRLRGATSKWILRETFRDRVPHEILERPKRGFDLPLAGWLRGPLQPQVADLLHADALAGWDGLDVDAATRLVTQHQQGKQDFGLPVFNMLSTMLFLRGS